jgi:hypothetical protein
VVVLLRTLLILGVIGLGAYCFLDVIRTDPERVQSLDKLVWLVVVLLPVLGPAAWLLLGRPMPAGAGAAHPHRPRGHAPDDSPEFLASLEEEIRRRRRADQLRHGGDAVDKNEVDGEIDRFEEEFGTDEDGGKSPS